MELILLRHGVAEDREEFRKKNSEDHLRPLTLKGRKKVQKVGVKLLDIISDFDLIVTSPFVRARQTAEIMSQIYFETPVVECTELVPQSPPQAFLKWLKIQGREHQRIIAVGHEPQLSTFASFMLANHEESFIELKKTGLLCLEMESFDQAQAGSAQLSWLLPASFLID